MLFLSDIEKAGKEQVEGEQQSAVLFGTFKIKSYLLKYPNRFVKSDNPNRRQ